MLTPDILGWPMGRCCGLDQYPHQQKFKLHAHATKSDAWGIQYPPGPPFNSGVRSSILSPCPFPAERLVELYPMFRAIGRSLWPLASYTRAASTSTPESSLGALTEKIYARYSGGADGGDGDDDVCVRSTPKSTGHRFGWMDGCVCNREWSRSRP